MNSENALTISLPALVTLTVQAPSEAGGSLVQLPSPAVGGNALAVSPLSAGGSASRGPYAYVTFWRIESEKSKYPLTYTLSFGSIQSGNGAPDISASIFEAKGDLLGASAVETPVRVAAGSRDGLLLSVDSAAAGGLVYRPSATQVMAVDASITGAGLPGVALAWAGTGSNSVHGYVYCFGFVVSEPVTYDAYLLQVQTGVASSLTDIAVYSTADWKVGTTMSKVSGTETTGLDTSSTGAKTVTLGESKTLDPGRYVLCVLSDTGASNLGLWFLHAAGYHGSNIHSGTNSSPHGWIQASGATSLAASYVIANLGAGNGLVAVMRRV